MENKVTADYLDEEGCLHCGICGKRKQMKVSLMGFEHELNASPTIKATSAKPITILTSNPPRFLMFCNVAIYFGFFNFYAIF